MAETWTVVLKPEDREQVKQLAWRRATLGLLSSYAETVRASVALAMTASDEDLRKGEL